MAEQQAAASARGGAQIVPGAQCRSATAGQILFEDFVKLLEKIVHTPQRNGKKVRLAPSLKTRHKSAASQALTDVANQETNRFPSLLSLDSFTPYPSLLPPSLKHAIPSCPHLPPSPDRVVSCCPFATSPRLFLPSQGPRVAALLRPVRAPAGRQRPLPLLPPAASEPTD
ncbi:hypothetical protein Agub_g7085 [Astrephomene gubernaculifera]|uniref:Uncharacterized protein n=1 Tax=Astrephomene gubernaculifera TaxID=47775 RepID=A0AAD3DPI5_9CHLO|nr:hypothetical protein Agub_g7085 [Astrephomene gubernaculifera]